MLSCTWLKSITTPATLKCRVDLEIKNTILVFLPIKQHNNPVLKVNSAHSGGYFYNKPILVVDLRLHVILIRTVSILIAAPADLYHCTLRVSFDPQRNNTAPINPDCTQPADLRRLCGSIGRASFPYSYLIIPTAASTTVIVDNRLICHGLHPPTLRELEHKHVVSRLCFLCLQEPESEHVKHAKHAKYVKHVIFGSSMPV